MRTAARTFVLTALLATAPFCAPSVHAQSSEHRGLQRAMAAYQAGDFARSLAILDSLPTSLPAADHAVRYLYRGLVLFANGQPDAGRESFVRAVLADPTVRLDPATHAPSRIRAYVAALDSMVTVWKAQAAAAEAADTALALRYWTRVATAMPSDTVAPARIAGLRPTQLPPVADNRSAQPAADTAPRPALSPADSAALAPLRRFAPGQAAMLGVVLPGLGQIYTGRPVVGVLVLGAAATALAVGVLKESVSVRCLTIPVDNFCPPDDVLSEEVERPYMSAGLGIAAAVTLVGALDAYFGARRANARAAAERGSESGRTGLHFERPTIQPRPGELRLALIRARF